MDTPVKMTVTDEPSMAKGDNPRVGDSDSLINDDGSQWFEGMIGLLVDSMTELSESGNDDHLLGSEMFAQLWPRRTLWE
jgi:hypothetical protein